MRPAISGGDDCDRDGQVRNARVSPSRLSDWRAKFRTRLSDISYPKSGIYAKEYYNIFHFAPVRLKSLLVEKECAYSAKY